MLDNLTVKEKGMLAALAIALAWGLGGGALRVRQSFIRSATPPPVLYRELLEALPDPEFLGIRSSREFSGSASDAEVVYITRPILPGDREIEVAEDGWIFFPRHYYTTININEAGVEDLATLPGIGPVTARRILDYREQYVGFIKLKAMKKVKGIGDKTLKRLEGRVRLY
jgi:competence ComEA-like helix-hairpin-helix protein